MRCLECKGFLSVSFIFDLAPNYVVYRCATAGVHLYRKDAAGKMRRVGSTTDHSELFFVQGAPGDKLRPCKPVDLGKATRKGLDGKKETYHRWTYEVTKAVAA